jgi:hypothetical protein
MMQFRLLYSGALYAHQGEDRLAQRRKHVHDIRRQFHKQLKKLWNDHPVLANKAFAKSPVIGAQPIRDFQVSGFLFRPLANETNGLICGLDILLLRDGKPGKALTDIDNRLKTIFDALRMGKEASELDGMEPKGDESPFYVVLQDDRLITHLSVTADTLLDPVPGVAPENAVRVVINVSIRPYDVHMDNLAFT